MSKWRRLGTAALSLWLCANAVAQEAEIVAKVNNQPITQEQYRQTLVDWFGKEVLEEMIQAEVIAQAAARTKITVTDEQVQGRLKALQTSMDERAKAGRGEPFQAWLASRRLTIPNLRSRLRTELLLEGMVVDRVKVPREEVSAYYENNRHRFREPAQVKISVISLKTEEEAKKVREMILKGEKTWGDAARDDNINPYTMKTGGALGYRTQDETPLMKAAFALEHDGEMSQPVHYGGLYNLVKREDRRNAQTTPFEEVKDSIKQALTEQKLFQLKKETRTALMDHSHIERLIQLPARSAEPGGG